MEADRFPAGSRVDVYCASKKDWLAATVLKTRVEQHVVDGSKTPCRAIFCEYDAGDLIRWHSMHDTSVRKSSSAPPPSVDQSDVPDPFPATTRVEVWCPKDGRWYAGTVLRTRAVQRRRALCREVLCEYEDGDVRYHSLQSTKVRTADGGGGGGGAPRAAARDSNPFPRSVEGA